MTSSDMTFPDDADGDALRRVANDGSDMSRPMAIDFAAIYFFNGNEHIVADTRWKEPIATCAPMLDTLE